MKILFLIFSILTPLTVFGQLGSHGRLISDFLDPNAINTQTFYTTQYKEIAGSPFLEDKAYPGTVILKDGTRVEDLLLRYSGYEDAVLYEMEGEKAAMIDPELISGFEYHKEGKKVRFISAVIFDKEKNFFEVIYEGKVSMYVRHQIVLSKKTDNTGGYGSKDLHGSAFKLKDKYVFTNEGGISQEVSLNKKSLLGAMTDKESAIEGYIKKNKVKLKDQNELIQLLQYYDSLD